MTQMLDAQVSAQVQDALLNISKPVEIAVYMGGSLVVPGRDEPGLERETLQLLREVAELNPHVSVVEGKFTDPEVADLNFTQSPTILFREQGSGRNNVRFLGLPSGYEFSTLIEILLMLGTGTVA